MATSISGLGAGLNLYSFFKGVDDSNDEYRQQQDEERKKLEEFRAQEKLARDQQNQAQLELERGQRNSEYNDAEPTRKLTTQKAIDDFESYNSPAQVELRRLKGNAATGKSINDSQVQIGANEIGAANMQKLIEQQKAKFEVGIANSDAQIEQGKLAVRLKTAITEATSKSPAFNDSSLRDMDASEFARLPTLKEKQGFLTSKGYGITVNDDGTYKLGSDPIAYTQDEVNEVLRNPSTAMAKILDARNARSTAMAAQTRANTATNNATAIAGATIEQKKADARKKVADAVATTNANAPRPATAKASLPSSPPALQASRPPLTGTVQSGGGTPAQSFSAPTTTTAVNPQNIRDSNEVGGDGVSNEINGMSLSELDVFKKALESAVLPSQPDENKIIFDRIREVNRAYGEKKGAENKVARDNESKSKEELAAKALAGKKSAEKLTQDAAKLRAEEFISKALAKAKNR